MYNIFFTGPIGIGKSTILYKVIEDMKCSVGGFISERYEQNEIKKFDMISLNDGKSNNIFATYDKNRNEMKINEHVFKNEAVDILNMAFKTKDVIIMDELGFMENNIIEFKETVYNLLNSNKPVIGVLKKHDCEFLNDIKNREDTLIVQVTLENRNLLKDKIMCILRKWNVPTKNAETFYSTPKNIELYNEALEHEINTYPKAIIEKIKKRIPNLNDLRVLDIGAGSGAFTIPLAEQGAKLMAIDSSFNMLNSLRHRAKNKNLDNKITCTLSPWEKVTIDKCDVAICAYNGGTMTNIDSMKKFYNSFTKYGFIVIPVSKERKNFNINDLYKRLGRKIKKYNSTSGDIVKVVNELGYKMEREILNCNLHQYFKNKDEAFEFIRSRHNIKTYDEVNTTKEFLNENLQIYNSGYLLKNTRECELITISR